MFRLCAYATEVRFCFINTTDFANPTEMCPYDTDNCQFERHPYIKDGPVTGCSTTCIPGTCNSTTEVHFCCCSGGNCNRDRNKFYCYIGLTGAAGAVKANACPGKETSCRWDHAVDGSNSLSVNCGGEFCKDKNEGCHVDEETDKNICCCRGELCNKND